MEFEKKFSFHFSNIWGLTIPVLWTKQYGVTFLRIREGTTTVLYLTF